MKSANKCKSYQQTYKMIFYMKIDIICSLGVALLLK